MPRQSEIPFDERVESIRLLLRGAINSGTRDGDFDNVCYQLIYALPKVSTCITDRRLNYDAGLSREKTRDTKDHIYRPRLWGLVFRRRPELLDSLDVFLPLVDELRTVCRCMTDENDTVKERERTDLGLPRSSTRSLYENCGIVTYSWSGDYRRTIKKVDFHKIPDTMHEIEVDVLGWV